MARPVVSTLLNLGDRERELRFDHDSLDALSGLTVAELGGDRSPLDLWRLAGGMNTKAMARMLWAASRHLDKNFTLQQMERQLTRALRERVVTYKRLNEVLNATMNQSEVIGLMVDDESDEGDEGNAVMRDGGRDSPADETSSGRVRVAHSG